MEGSLLFSESENIFIVIRTTMETTITKVRWESISTIGYNKFIAGYILTVFKRFIISI